MTLSMVTLTLWRLNVYMLTPAIMNSSCGIRGLRASLHSMSILFCDHVSAHCIGPSVLSNTTMSQVFESSYDNALCACKDVEIFFVIDNSNR